MARPLIFTDREAAFLRELVRQKVPFMIVGLSAATLQGAPAVTQDIDLWFQSLRHPGIRRALRKVGGSYIPPMALNPPMFEGENVRLFDIVVHMDGLASFAAEYRRAIDVPLGGVTVKVLPLDRIIASKKAANREKDKIVLRVLRDALLTIKATEVPRRPPKR